MVSHRRSYVKGAGLSWKPLGELESPSAFNVDPLLFIPIGLGLAVAFAGLWWISRRLTAMESGLKELSPLALVPDRLQALAKVIEESDPEAVKAEFDRIHDALSRLEDLALTGPEAGAAGGGTTRPAKVRAFVIRWLRDEGYYSARILNEDDELSGQEIEVVVEAVKDGLRYRGHVLVQGNEIQETNLDPSYSMFP